MTKRNILISGASGLVGMGLLNLLKDDTKYRISALYRSTEPVVKSGNISYIKGDLTKKETWRRLKELDADAFVHCAAKVPKTFGASESREYRFTNLEMDSFAISYAREKDIRLVYISSSSVYGTPTNKPLSEDLKLRPSHEYAKGKAESERRITGNRGVARYFILRPSAPYGPHQRTRTVLKTFIKNALEGSPLLYYGSGGRMQDFIYAADVGRACVAALESDNFGIYNIASGRSISMKEVALFIKRLLKSRSRVGPAGIEDPQEFYKPVFDISKAKEFLGWRPVWPLEKGLKKFIEYLKENEL